MDLFLNSKNLYNNQNFSNYCKSIINVKIGTQNNQKKFFDSSTYLFNNSKAYLLTVGHQISKYPQNLTKDQTSLILYDPAQLIDLNDENTNLITNNIPLISTLSNITLLEVKNNKETYYHSIDYLSRVIKKNKYEYLSLPLTSDYLGKCVCHGESKIEIIGCGHSVSLIDGNLIYEISYIADKIDEDFGSFIIKSNQIHSFYTGNLYTKNDNYEVENVLYRFTPAHFVYFQAENILDYEIEELKYSIHIET